MNEKLQPFSSLPLNEARDIVRHGELANTPRPPCRASQGHSRIHPVYQRPEGSVPYL
jgi:hypothetical protein